MPSDESGLRMAVDVGGTFTDTVLADRAGSILASAKTLTTHAGPAEGALAGMQRVLSLAGVSPDAVGVLIHGTTLATNALIERRGARVATVATEGFRDILEIAYEARYSQYDVNLTKPDLLVPRERSFTVGERMSAEGAVLRPLDEATVPELAAHLDACGAEAIAICLLHSYANAAHELRLRDLLRAHCPDRPIAISSETSPEAREFDRLCTTVANACLQPLMARFLTALEQRLQAAGLHCPILMMTAGGGMCTLDYAKRVPVRLVESGPAGGAILAARIAAECNLAEVVSFDMGGTTAKLCLIDDARPQTSRRFEIARAERFLKGSGMPVRIPVIEMIEIGAGGGSIAAMDRLGRLVVGPRSAGSEPGPAAFNRGGEHPTVTDADVVLGLVRPEAFAGGEFDLDPARARAALLRGVGAAAGLDAAGAAEGISRIVDESMASAARMHAAESGKDLAPRTLIAFGGNGPLHACRVARLAGISRILVPARPGVGSAVGFLYAPVSLEIVRSRYTLLDTLDRNAIRLLLEEMAREAAAIVRQGAPHGDLIIRRAAFMRYRGQGHEIAVSLPARTLGAAGVASLRAAFEAAYAEQYSRPVPGMAIEILNWLVQVSTPARAVPPPAPDPAPRVVEAEGAVRIRCDVTGRDCAAALVHRAELAPGDTLCGPALILEAQTTTFIGRDFTARVDGQANLVLTQDRSGGGEVNGLSATGLPEIVGAFARDGR